MSELQILRLIVLGMLLASASLYLYGRCADRPLPKVAGFVVLLAGLFAWLGSSVPQQTTKGAGAAGELARLSPAEFAKAGEKIFLSKPCVICHVNTERGPKLAGVGARASARRPGMSALEYLVESLYDPRAYIVEGFPPIMPAANSAEVRLTPMEAKAVISYLLSLGGEPIGPEAEVTFRGKPLPEVQRAEKLPGDPDAGAAVFVRRGRCIACHTVQLDGHTVGGSLGPDLSEIGSIQTAAYIRESILEPQKFVVKGYPDQMPRHFGKHLSQQELDDLVSFLLTRKAASPSSP